MYDTIIIGAGPAGLTAAIYAGRKEMKTAVITVEVGGQCNLTAEIENYPGVLKDSGMNLIEIFRQQAVNFGAELIYGKVNTIKKVEDYFEITMGNEDKYQTKTIILSYGKVPRKLNIPGEDKFLGRGVSTCATCDGPFYKEKTVAVIGGGNSALEAALELSRVAKKIYLVHRRQEFRGDEITVKQVKENPKIELVLETLPLEIQGDKFVHGLIVEDLNSKEQHEIQIDGVFLEIGYVVDGSLVKDLLEINSKNEIVKDNLCLTSQPGIFAAGDVSDMPFKQVVIAAGEGAKAALSAYAYLGGKISKDWKD